MTYLLGISAYYHDSAAAILKDGVIIAAAQEERFTRIKQDSNFPIKAIEYCLKENAPMFGGFKEFQKDMPDAVSQIMNSKNDTELPFYRTQGVLRNEMMQKLFNFLIRH